MQAGRGFNPQPANSRTFCRNESWDKSYPCFPQREGCELLVHSRFCLQVEFQVKSEMGSNQGATKVKMSLGVFLDGDYRV